MLLLVVGFSAVSVPSPFVAVVAYADDDDDDDGQPGAGNMRSGGSYKSQKQRSRAIRGARRSAPLPLRERYQIVAIGLDATDKDQLVRSGYVILDDQTLLSIPSTDLTRLRVPRGKTIQAAREEVAALASVAADLNHYYRPSGLEACEGRTCSSYAMVNWNPVEVATCAGDTTIGVIDTSINLDHDTLRSAKVEAKTFRPERAAASGPRHGTAIASLLVGAADSAVPGLLPNASILAADPFYRAGRRDERTDAYDLSRALDYLLSRRPAVVNMSLSGPANDLLEAMVLVAEKQGVQIVAAAGNDGPRAQPAYPAAYPTVLAVTALDRNKRVFRRANQGPHIDFAAPGVGIWLAAPRKGTLQFTGTSYAAPFVSAAVAVLKSHEPELEPVDLRTKFQGFAEDLGKPGHDPVFGHGLINGEGICSKDS